MPKRKTKEPPARQSEVFKKLAHGVRAGADKDADEQRLAGKKRQVQPDHGRKTRTKTPRDASNWSVELNIEPLGSVQIRPIRPQDADLYPAFADRITVDDRRRRFLHAGPKELTPALLAQFTQIDRKREMAFVAIHEKSNALLGVVRIVTNARDGGAEFAVVVRSDLQGKGIGTALMRHLVRYARSANVTRLHGSVSAENSTMLRMCRTLGFVIEDAGDGSLRQVVLPLGDI